MTTFEIIIVAIVFSQTAFCVYLFNLTTKKRKSKNHSLGGLSIFNNPDAGVVGVYASRLNNDTVIEYYGVQFSKDGLLYWMFPDGTRKRILTERDYEE